MQQKDQLKPICEQHSYLFTDHFHYLPIFALNKGAFDLLRMHNDLDRRFVVMNQGFKALRNQII